ncbi:hypothetical protein [Sphingobium tyrosinilyticum]|uniref:Uncharacterized protein n=1 Tax=Sphingobium tyrosinilyticum TaxID=2715436 RepID=A0ABV9EX86_9SPHN
MSEDIRQHTLPLEDVQRIHLGLERHDPMEFSAATIAEMLQSIAHEVSEAKAAKIHGVVRALLGLDQHHRLELSQVRRGKHKMAHDYAADRAQYQAWLDKLAHYEQGGVKTEAAIASIAEEWRVSRATVFAGIRAAELDLAMGRSMEEALGKWTGQYENRRPNKGDLA